VIRDIYFEIKHNRDKLKKFFSLPPRRKLSVQGILIGIYLILVSKIFLSTPALFWKGSHPKHIPVASLCIINRRSETPKGIPHEDCATGS
jgi:hypothetical protein